MVARWGGGRCQKVQLSAICLVYSSLGSNFPSEQGVLRAEGGLSFSSGCVWWWCGRVSYLFFSVWIAKRFWGTRFSPVRIVDKTRHRLLLFVCLSVGLRQKVLVLVSLVLVDTK